MKINYYTITSSAYSKYTELMLKSFIQSGSTGTMYVLTIDDIENPIKHNNIEYVSCKPIISQYEIDYPQKNLISWWMKSRAILFTKIIDTEYICYSDSDILFFKNIDKFIENTINKYGNHNLYIANDGVRILNNPLINSGFYFVNTKTYPYIDLMNLWHEKMFELLKNIQTNPNKKIYKYLDQLTLRECLKQDKYSKYNVLHPYIIGYRRYSKNRVLTHYIKKYKVKMAIDYKRFVAKT